jgi:predicted RND superfamily exporter protein
MTGLINEMTTEMNSTNIMINNLKTKNALLKEKASNLHKNVLTSDGLFDGELEWYRQQLKIVLVMLIGIIICSVMFYQMNLTVKDKLVAFIIVIVLGTLFTYIANFFVNTPLKI